MEYRDVDIRCGRDQELGLTHKKERISGGLHLIRSMFLSKDELPYSPYLFCYRLRWILLLAGLQEQGVKLRGSQSIQKGGCYL